jgi:hypothetical protein
LVLWVILVSASSGDGSLNKAILSILLDFSLGKLNLLLFEMADSWFWFENLSSFLNLNNGNLWLFRGLEFFGDERSIS